MRQKIIRWTNSNVIPHTDEAWLRFVQEACTDDKHCECLDLGACRDAVSKGGDPAHCRTCLSNCHRIIVNIEFDKDE
jgi:hypothetical protein